MKFDYGKSKKQYASVQTFGSCQAKSVGLGSRADDSLRKSKSVRNHILRAIVLASTATVLLPVILIGVLSLLSESMPFAQSADFVFAKAGSVGSILLVLNLIVVFLGLSVPEIVKGNARRL